jgi:hypothetical protein
MSNEIASPPSAKQARETLIRARKLIESPANWDKGNSQKVGDCYCAQTAIEEAANYDNNTPAYKAFLAAIGKPNDTLFDIWDWNDADERTHSDILMAFDDAISMADHQSDAEAQNLVSSEAADGPQS